MGLTTFINLPVLIISFVFGLFFIHINGQDREKITVHPTPDNCGKIEYVDKTGNCFEFESFEVKCPSSKKMMKEIPVQT